MHVFIPVFFNAPLGGLQSHVRAQVRALLGMGHRCTVMCKQGAFASSVRELGAAVVETGFEFSEKDVSAAREAGPYDLVHAHPFASRKVGLEVARLGDLPFMLTLHGMYTDSLSRYAREVSLVIAVSPAIRDLVLADTPLEPARVVVVPNAVDTEVFYPREEQAPGQGERRIALVTRMDADKQFILDLVQETWKQMPASDWTWRVAGDGTEREKLEAAAEEVNARMGRRCISFLGWQEEHALAELYNSSHLCIAPGRSALDCMACGTPVIAIGSKGYLGLLDETQCLKGMYGNFGGQGSGHQDYRPGTLLNEIQGIIHDNDRLGHLGSTSARMIESFFDQKQIDGQLLSLYWLCSGMEPAGKSLVHAERIERPGFSFLNGRWTWPEGEDRELTPQEGDSMRVAFRLHDADKFYLTTPTGDFSKPPVDTPAWRLEPGRHYELSTVMKVVEGAPQVQLWVIQYDDTRRLTHSTGSMREGVVSLPFTTLDSTRSFKTAFRFSGSGTVEIAAIELSELRETEEPAAAFHLRETVLPEEQGYRGENLVFVIGAPRSGTTWVLNLLKEHPDVVAATLDNLDARMNDAPTLETNVFNDDRPFTDEQIRSKFHNLSCRNPGRVIVEKTPIHLLFVDRIRRIFPRAALILVERDGRDVVNSLVQVGRDPGAWWRGAPDTVEQAALLWKRYAQAGLRCRRLFHPLVVSYERLIEAPEPELKGLLTGLGLSNEHLQSQIQACRGGVNIPIPGVFREGKTGSWRQAFSAEDVAAFKRIAADALLETSGVDPESW